ncbi:MAG: CGNR zinc finger domain-containing protein [Vulcanimicrobiaceae bacterium]
MIRKADFRFNRGSLALDFTATRGYRKGRAVERVPAPADLGRWFAAASLAERTATTLAEYRRAIALREAIYSLGSALLEARKPAASDVATINAAAAARRATQELDPKTLRIRQAARASVGTALARIAEDAIALFGGPDRARLRSCRHPSCGALMLNAQSGPERQWCSMATCGNRAKVAAYRQRQSAPASAKTAGD